MTFTAVRIRNRDATWWIATASVIVTSALLLFLGLTRLSPVFFGDEIGYFANAISIAGGPNLAIDADSYYPGWSLVLVPLWWATQNALAFYRGAVILSAVSAIATIPVLAVLGRRLGLRTAHAVIAACLVVGLPAHALMSGFGLAESFLYLVTAAATLLTAAALRSGSTWLFAAAGAVTGFAFVIHGRVVGMLIATLLLAIVLLVRRRWVHAAALAGAMIVVAGLGYALYRHLEVVVYRSTGREADGVAKLFGSAPGAIALSGAGQLWYVVVATAGLSIPGAIFLGRAVVREIRTRRPGWAAWTALWILGLAAVSITYVSSAVADRGRLDIFVYGRYLEPATDLLAFFGLVLLVRVVPSLRWRSPRIGRRWIRILIASFSTFVAIAGGYAVLAHAVVPTAEETTSGWNPMNVFGIVQYDWVRPGDATRLPIGMAALFAGGTFVVLFALRIVLKNPSWMLVGAVLFALTSTVCGQARTVEPVYSGWARAFTLELAVAEYPGASVAFVTLRDPAAPTRSTVISQNAYQFFLAPRTVPLWTTTTGTPATDFAIGRRLWPAGTEAGWRIVAADIYSDNALWERPDGPAADGAPTVH